MLSGFTSAKPYGLVTDLDSKQSLDGEENTDMDPVFAMKLLYSLSCASQDFLPFCQRQLQAILNQGEQSASKTGID
jgi:hypothetical protein